MTEISEDVLNSLAAKVEALELSDEEQAVLDSALSRAEAFEPDVEGFRSFSYLGLNSGANLAPMSFRLGRASGLIGRPGGMTESLTESRGYRTEA